MCAPSRRSGDGFDVVCIFGWNFLAGFAGLNYESSLIKRSVLGASDNVNSLSILQLSVCARGGNFIKYFSDDNVRAEAPLFSPPQNFEMKRGICAVVDYGDNCEGINST